MPRLLTDEEILEATKYIAIGAGVLKVLHSVSQAQATLTRLETAREIFGQIDCCLWDLGRYDPESFEPEELMKTVLSAIKQYQVYKSRYLEGK